MPTLPTKQTGVTEPVETVEEKFQRLASAWRADAAYVSSGSDLVTERALQQIVGIVPAIIPLLLRELESRTGRRHRGLRLITGADSLAPPERAISGRRQRPGCAGARSKATNGGIRPGVRIPWAA